jgi:hypothetical protein
MTEQEFSSLPIGATVQHASGGLTYVVTDNWGGRVTAVRVADMTNPGEWVVTSRPTGREFSQGK